jgi:hypothetical protein
MPWLERVSDRIRAMVAVRSPGDPACDDLAGPVRAGPPRHGDPFQRGVCRPGMTGRLTALCVGRPARGPVGQPVRPSVAYRSRQRRTVST